MLLEDSLQLSDIVLQLRVLFREVDDLIFIDLQILVLLADSPIKLIPRLGQFLLLFLGSLLDDDDGFPIFGRSVQVSLRPGNGCLNSGNLSPSNTILLTAPLQEA